MGHMMKKVEHGKKKSAGKTAVYIGQYSGNPLLQIFEVNEENENISDRSLIQFGLVKAKAILNHVAEIEAFVKEQEK